MMEVKKHRNLLVVSLISNKHGTSTILVSVPFYITTQRFTLPDSQVIGKVLVWHPAEIFSTSQQHQHQPHHQQCWQHPSTISLFKCFCTTTSLLLLNITITTSTSTSKKISTNIDYVAAVDSNFEEKTELSSVLSFLLLTIL